MESLYGVLGMMVVIVAIAIAFVMAPRRARSWRDDGASKKPAPPRKALRRDRWKLRDETIDAVGATRLVSCERDGRVAIRSEGPNLEGAARLLDHTLVDEAQAKLLEDGAGAWEGECEGQPLLLSAPLDSDEPDVAALRKWLAERDAERSIGELVMISIPAIDYRVPFERATLRDWRHAAVGRSEALASVVERNAEERAWVEQAREMSKNAARAATVDDGTLKDLEAYARAADDLADRKDDAQAMIEAGVKRRFLLVQLAAFSLLDPREKGLAESLSRRGYPLLAGLHTAACTLASYLESAERAEIVGSVPVPVLAAPLSLDLFRRGGLVMPQHLPRNKMLAHAEAELLWDASNARGSFTYIKSGGFRYQYGLRVEDGLRTVIASLAISGV